MVIHRLVRRRALPWQADYILSLASRLCELYATFVGRSSPHRGRAICLRKFSSSRAMYMVHTSGSTWLPVQEYEGISTTRCRFVRRPPAGCGSHSAGAPMALLFYPGAGLEPYASRSHRAIFGQELLWERVEHSAAAEATRNAAMSADSVSDTEHLRAGERMSQCARQCVLCVCIRGITLAGHLIWKDEGNYTER